MKKYFLKFFIPALLVLLVSIFVYIRQIKANDFFTIDSEVVWNKDLSPIVVSKSIYVADSGKLTIEPGVVIKFSKNQSFSVRGILNAIGTKEDPIIFTSIKDDNHGGDANKDGNATTPMPKDWYSFNISNGGEAGLDNIQILYGGGYDNKNF